MEVKREAKMTYKDLIIFNVKQRMSHVAIEREYYVNHYKENGQDGSDIFDWLDEEASFLRSLLNIKNNEEDSEDGK